MFIVQIDKTFLVLTRSITVLEACQLLQKQIPTFCYHPFLMLEGNCRMCLVEIDKLAKPQASCCLPIQHNMKIFTNSPFVKKAREAVLEFLLLNHPLDCPVCDQGGECDLQDNAFKFSFNRSRIKIKKQPSSNAFYNSFIKTIMTRCINCTKCVRYITEFYGKPILGSLNRGILSEIGAFNKTQLLNFEFSGNLIDICPVGALTSKPYSFKFRPWELTSTTSIDIMDSFGANLRVDNCKAELVRILPCFNSLINSFWINDRIRFCFDAFFFNRYKQPCLNQQQLVWTQSLLFVNSLLVNFKRYSLLIINTSHDLLTLFLLKLLTIKYNLTIQLSYYKIINTFTQMFLFNTLSRLKTSTVNFMIGCNLRYEVSNLHLLLTTEQQKRLFSFFTFGFFPQSTYQSNHLGFQHFFFSLLASGKLLFCRKFLIFQSLLFLLNSKIYDRFDNCGFQYLFNSLLDRVILNQNNLSYYQLEANTVGSLLYGFQNSKKTSKISLSYEINDPLTVQKTPVKIQQCSYILPTTKETLLILPNSLFIEFLGAYINMDGFFQVAYPCTKPFFESKPDSRIFLTLLKTLNLCTSNYQLLQKKFIMFTKIKKNSLLFQKLFKGVFHFFFLNRFYFSSFIENFYTHNLITRHSKVLTQYSQLRTITAINFY